MKRIWTLFLVFGVALAMAVPAYAAKPDKPGKPGPEPPEIDPCPAAVQVDNIKRTYDFECEWSPSDSTPTPADGTVAVEVTRGSITYLAVSVRDSSPGDICVLESEWLDASGESLMPLGAGSAVVATFPLVYGGESYWDAPVHWCSRFDPIDGIRADLNGDPLHFQIYLRAARGTDIAFFLTP